MAKETKYFEAIGRRKTSRARVRLTPSSKTTFNINDKNLEDYFQTQELKNVLESLFNKMKMGEFSVSVKVNGGGIHSQAEAVRHGIARALEIHNPTNRTKLKSAGFLKRDPRTKERRKFGLKKARKAPKWSKR